MTTQPASRVMSVPTISRGEWAQALGNDLKPGDHVSALGPTGLGKSTAIAQLAGELDPSKWDMGALLCPKGRDKAYAPLGARVIKQWPPQAHWTERLQSLMGSQPQNEDRIKFYEVAVPIRSTADLTTNRNLYGQVLASVMARPEAQPGKGLFLVADDTNSLCDPQFMNLAAYIRNDLMLGRSKGVTIVSNVQRPAFVPRQILDQATHVLIWRNRDRDVAKRLTEISGAIDPKEMEATILGLGYHSFVWVDGRADSYEVVAAD